jgi:hypothetical protein
VGREPTRGHARFTPTRSRPSAGRVSPGNSRRRLGNVLRYAPVMALDSSAMATTAVNNGASNQRNTVAKSPTVMSKSVRSFGNLTLPRYPRPMDGPTFVVQTQPARDM